MTSIKDIAARCGLSIATVSRALNGAANVRPETSDLVRRTARELDYHPSAVARSLVEQRSRIFGYIVSGLERGARHSIIQDSLAGIYAFATSIGHEILMFAVDSTRQHAKSYVDFAREHALAGVIMQGLRTDDDYYADIVDSRIPCVLIDLPAESERVGSVSIDNRAATRDVVRHLVLRGHRRIAFLGGLEAAAVSTQRKLGYLEALDEGGLETSPDWIMSGDFKEERAYESMRRFLPDHPEVSAVCCASDLMAIGVLRAARSLGLAVPGRLAVTGFDDIGLAAYVSPPLTTIHQDFGDLGYEAARMLSCIVRGESTPHTLCLPYTLVVRESA